jgi:hypothetical protein
MQQRVRHWLKISHPGIPDNISIEWLALSLFDLHTRFCLSFGQSLTIDVAIVRDEMTVITQNEWSNKASSAGQSSSTAYRKVKFRSDAEFEIFLKIELQRSIRSQSQQ